MKTKSPSADLEFELSREHIANAKIYLDSYVSSDYRFSYMEKKMEGASQFHVHIADVDKAEDLPMIVANFLGGFKRYMGFNNCSYSVAEDGDA